MATLNVKGARLHFDESGRGRLALFLHGRGLDCTLWRQQLQGLADLRRCVALDLPGHGRSSEGTLDLEALIKALGHRRADLVGHSWGGHEVLAAWHRNPRRVRSIALLGVMFSADMPRASVPTRASLPQRPVPVEAQRGVVRSISVPLLVAVGDEDTVTPSQACQRLAACNPAAHFVLIPGAGHLAPLDRPGAVNAALRVLWYHGKKSERRFIQRNTRQEVGSPWRPR